MIALFENFSKIANGIFCTCARNLSVESASCLFLIFLFLVVGKLREKKSMPEEIASEAFAAVPVSNECISTNDLPELTQADLLSLSKSKKSEEKLTNMVKVFQKLRQLQAVSLWKKGGMGKRREAGTHHIVKLIERCKFNTMSVAWRNLNTMQKNHALPLSGADEKKRDLSDMGGHSLCRVSSQYREMSADSETDQEGEAREDLLSAFTPEMLCGVLILQADQEQWPEEQRREIISRLMRSRL